MVNWKESDMYDVLPSKSVVPPEGCDILCLNEGMTCRGLYSGEYHDATVVATGQCMQPACIALYACRHLMLCHTYREARCYDTVSEET